MVTIIAGSRYYNDYKVIEENIKKCPWEITKIISGGCRGVDRLGEEYARKNDIELEIVEANWKRSGKSAGPRRNKVMMRMADALIAFKYETSKGTNNMISIMNWHKPDNILVIDLIKGEV